MKLKARILKALLRCCSDDECREVLKSVAVSENCVVATNTHIAAWVGTIPLKEGKFASTSNLAKTLAVTVAGMKPTEARNVEIDTDSLEPCAGAYPNVCRVVPVAYAAVPFVWFNATYIGDIVEMARACSESKNDLALIGLSVGEPSRPMRFICTTGGGWDKPEVISGVLMPHAAPNVRYGQEVEPVDTEAVAIK